MIFATLAKVFAGSSNGVAILFGQFLVLVDHHFQQLYDNGKLARSELAEQLMSFRFQRISHAVLLGAASKSERRN